MDICPYCGGRGDIYLRVVSKEYRRCLTCDLLYKDISKSYDQVLSTYRHDYYHSHSVDQTTGSRDKLFVHILDLIEKKKSSGRLLDVGTGCGFFLVAAQKRGWEVKGIEPSVLSVEVARRQNQLDVFSGTLGEYDGNAQFDVITFINVLDHSAMPWLEIDWASKLLRPGGIIYLRFPNGFLHSQIYRLGHKCGLSKSLRKFLVFHMHSFTPTYVSRLLSDKGFVQATILNSPPSEGDPHRLFPNPTFASYVKRLIYSFSKYTETISHGRLFWGSSLEVTAIKPT